MKANAKQIVALALGVLGVGLLVYFLIFGRGPQIRKVDELVMMDVVTGDRFIVDTSGARTAVVPAKHPETGERTLLPVSQGDDGEWYVYRIEAFEGLPDSQMPAVIDRESGRANPSERAPRKIRR